MNASSGQLIRLITEAVDAGETVCVATVVQTSRSVPRRAGSKMLVYSDGRSIGTIGGGEMESRVVQEALAAIADRTTRLCTYQLVNPSTGDPGVCGGEATISLEPFMPTPTVYVVGCGHVGKAVVELAHWMGFRVIATDDRPGLATPDELPLADATVSGHITDSVREQPITAETHVVVVTRNMAIDLDLLPHLLATPARTIGVMGSQRRWTETRTALLAAGVQADSLERITAPIGIELHAETPEEIAVSILAEIVSLRRSSHAD
jgi:xanthine dehydrogenase accessory factor